MLNMLNTFKFRIEPMLPSGPNRERKASVSPSTRK